MFTELRSLKYYSLVVCQMNYTLKINIYKINLFSRLIIVVLKYYIGFHWFIQAKFLGSHSPSKAAGGSFVDGIQKQYKT